MLKQTGSSEKQSLPIKYLKPGLLKFLHIRVTINNIWVAQSLGRAFFGQFEIVLLYK
jgi:hypothetical protein